MSHAPPDSFDADRDANDPILAEWVEELKARNEAGAPVDLAPYVQQDPERAERLRLLLPAIALMAELGRSGEPSPGLDPPSDRPVEPMGSLGDFRILREVGRGGMGVVYEAEQLSLGRRVALKVLPFAAAIDPKHLRRFQLEAQAAAQLHHTHIVPVHCVGCERGVSYYAMQFIDGQTVAELIADLRRMEGRDASGPASELSKSLAAGSFAPAEREATPKTVAGTASSSVRSTRTHAFFRTVARLGIQAAEALHHAHEQGVLHRDVKPSNLMVDAQGDLWVTDFGLARIRGDSDLTQTGDLIGTLRYMSPEQALGRRVVIDERSDVYSLGVTLYELLALRPAFEGHDRADLLRRIAFEEPLSPRRLEPAIPHELETIVLKAMAKEIEDRYATSQELADDLQRFLEHRPIKARPPTLTERASKWARRNTPAVAASTALLVLTTVGLSIGTALMAAKQGELEQQRLQAVANLAEARLQRQRAAYNFGTLLERLTFLVKLLRDPKTGESAETTAMRREMSNEVVEFVRRFIKESGNEQTMRLVAVYAQTNIGKIYDLLGEPVVADREFASAIALAEELVTDYPMESSYRVHLGHLHENMGQRCGRAGRLEEGLEAFREGEKHFRLAVAVDPRNTNALNFLAWQLAACPIERLRKPDEAIHWARRGIALAKEPEQGRIWNTLGVAYYRKGEWRNAIAAQEQASRLRPGGPTDDEYFILAMAYWRLGEKEVAHRYYDQALEWSRARLETPEVQSFYAEATSLLERQGTHNARP